MTYQETLDYLYNNLPMFQRIGGAAFNKSLDKTLALCLKLDNPQNKFKTIHIAGTNGKGSVSSMIAAVLQKAGYKTGLFTSPHLKSFTERIRINGAEIGPEEVVDFVERYQIVMEELKPSFFELTTVMAFDYFARNNIDIAVVEVGMGGRLDSTNVVYPELSVITNISFDHQAYLGNTLPEIAGEKAGIIKDNVPVVLSEFQPEVIEVFRQKALSHRSPLELACERYTCRDMKTYQGGLQVDVYANEKLIYKDLFCDLGGIYQLKNIPAVLASVDIMNDRGFAISKEQLRQGLLNVKGLTGLKGRWQTLQERPLVICDTGHNEGGFRYIIEQLSLITYSSLHIVLGVVKDKEVSPVLELLPKNARYYFCQPDLPRAMDAHTLAATALEYGLQGIVISDVNGAVSRAISVAAPDDLIFIGGSNFVIAELDML